MLRLNAYLPDAADGSQIEARPNWPTLVVWMAEDGQGKRVKVLIGFQTIRYDAINAFLRNNRDSLEADANAAHKPGDFEVVIFAKNDPMR